MTDPKPVYHDQNLKEAKARAKKIRGLVIRSSPPNTKHPADDSRRGYWSDSADTVVRGWEQVVADFSES